ALGVAAIGLIPVAIAGLWGYMSVTATPLHPNVTEVPSVARAAPLPTWAGAVARGQQIVSAALTEKNLPGLSVAVAVGGDIVWAEGFGWADIEKRAPVSPEMRFRIGTASTALTSAAVGVLLQDGRLNLDEDIQTYVPEFPQNQSPVTLRQLMANVGGVPDDGGDEGPLFTQRCERPADAFQFLSGYERERLFEPGTQYHYSSYGWIAVSAAVEAAAKEPFLTFMQKRVFEPLGMRDTRADSATEIPNRVTPYFPRFAADPHYGPDLMRPLDYSCYAGASVFLSTPSDLVRFAMAIDSGKLLKPATVQLLQASQRLTSGEETGYGLGWDLETVALGSEHTRSVGHEGTSLGGNVSSLITFPDHGIVVALASNISYADTPAIALKIAQAFVEQARDK
ncbi:MAG TPA: serine hydrolase domain-containing protein, partial [Vicinamibacterales bacterium]|nr:serine hydrolase domain-containing protein [Vicinamibacterales bacterium]